MNVRVTVTVNVNVIAITSARQKTSGSAQTQKTEHKTEADQAKGHPKNTGKTKAISYLVTD